MNIQYKKGVVELCIFSLLYTKDCYGYDISEYLSKHINISDGTVYPILRKLKSDGFVTTYISEVSGGPPRKYYKLTKLGEKKYLADKGEWLDFIVTVQKLLQQEAQNE